MPSSAGRWASGAPVPSAQPKTQHSAPMLRSSRKGCTRGQTLQCHVDPWFSTELGSCAGHKPKRCSLAKHCATTGSHVIPQRSTGVAQPSLTSVIGREPVLYRWYERSIPGRFSGSSRTAVGASEKSDWWATAAGANPLGQSSAVGQPGRAGADIPRQPGDRWVTRRKAQSLGESLAVG